MFRNGTRNLTLTLALLALLGPTLHAQTSTPLPSPTQTAPDDGVTGGDPEPPSPSTVQIILSIWLLA